MKTDKLYYQIFLTQPELLADLIPGVPTDCAFEYVAPVVKESEWVELSCRRPLPYCS
jgi:hypothetical protein